ncbi:MAG: CocE/NonD family hydrolase, partial [Acidobacteriota bacterium]
MTITLPALLVATLGAAQPPFDSHAVSTVMVAMRDGVRLATDVYRPAHAGQPAGGKFPALVYRTPYDKSGQSKDGAFFAQRGYVVVVQDCRGRFASEGDFYAFINEGQDGYDAIEWVAAQPWSDGKVGTIGGSYLAWDQYHAAMYRPPHLAAMFALVGGANFYQEYAYPGGAPNLGWPMWLLNSAATSQQAARDPAAAAALQEIRKKVAPWLALHPRQRQEAFRLLPAHLKMYQDFYDHPVFDASWRQRGFYTAGYHREMKDVPILFMSGWYDYFGEGVLDNFMALARIQKTPKKLVMGPWPHGVGASECGDVSFGAAAAVNQRELALDWFDHWLKGQPLRLVSPEPVRIFRMGGGDGSRGQGGRFHHGGEWRSSAAWPPPETRPSNYYLHPGGTLSASPPPRAKPSSFVFDPDNPVPTIGGRYGGCAQNQVCSPKITGCADSSPLTERPDVLSFSTAPLERPLEVTGKIRATLWISSDAPDTDYTAKLVDVHPDGYALILTDRQIRTRYRNGFEKPELMKPGRVYKVV